MNDLSIAKVDPTNPDLLNLIAKLDAELFSKYPSEDVFVVDFSDPTIEDTVFVVAYLGNIAAGCGAYRPLDGHSVELKRIFVDHDYRNKGIATKILMFLENDASLAGYTTIRLETGPLQPESIALYKKYGYSVIERYGEYVNCENSICMEKKI